MAEIFGSICIFIVLFLISFIWQTLVAEFSFDCGKEWVNPVSSLIIATLLMYVLILKGWVPNIF